jgi:hypothetical protein
MMNDYKDRQRELAQLDLFRKPRLERAERAYTQAITSLWLGNAGAAIATLSFIGVVSKNGEFHRSLLVPLGFFVLGLISMGLGAAWFLVREARIIRRMEGMTSMDEILSLSMNDIHSEAELAGLSFDSRTWASVVAAGAFILGIIAGLVIIAASFGK